MLVFVTWLRGSQLQETRVSVNFNLVKLNFTETQSRGIKWWQCPTCYGFVESRVYIAAGPWRAGHRDSIHTISQVHVTIEAFVDPHVFFFLQFHIKTLKKCWPSNSNPGYTGAGHKIRIFSIYNADFGTWHLHTVPKLPVSGLRTMVSLFLIGQQTRLTLKPSKIYGVLWRGRWGGGIFLSWCVYLCAAVCQSMYGLNNGTFSPKAVRQVKRFNVQQKHKSCHQT